MSSLNTTFEAFVNIIKDLRGPEGCPWDKEQTFKSLVPFIVEEAYELVEGLQNEDPQSLKEELGDVLLHVVMISNMAEEKGWFTIHDVIQNVHDKMIRRHPHVFGDKKADSIDQVWENWESMKQKEQKTSVFSSIPTTLPALMQAQKIKKRLKRHNLTENQEHIDNEPNQVHLTALLNVVEEANEAGVDLETTLLTWNKNVRQQQEAMKEST